MNVQVKKDDERVGQVSEQEQPLKWNLESGKREERVR